MRESNRIRYIDIAKGIAIICIIMGHVGNWNINRIVFTFHVPIFFFITGYFLNDKRNLKEFVRIKCKTLIVPYILTCLAMIILGTLMGQIQNADAMAALKKWMIASLYGAGSDVTSPFYVPAIGALWFLLATFWGSCFLRVSFNFHPYVRILTVLALFSIGYFTRTYFWLPFSLQAGACATLFMYMGWLWKDIRKSITTISREIKDFGLVVAALSGGAFIKNFQSFWLVSCDIGRGIVDIYGCACACIVVIAISKWIDSNLKHCSAFLAYFGKFSLLVLCIHILEQNLFPWVLAADKAIQFGMPEAGRLLYYIFGKLTMDLTCAYILSKSVFVRRLFGMKE